MIRCGCGEWHGGHEDGDQSYDWEETYLEKGCNTPFSGLAADGAKLAMFNLMHIGFRVVAFIHDEVVVEIPENSNLNEEARVMDRVMVESMESVCHNVPIKCEYAASRVWSKLAAPVFGEDGALREWVPAEGELDV